MTGKPTPTQRAWYAIQQAADETPDPGKRAGLLRALELLR